jgi:integral membrane sensor domain MASE1
MKDFWKISEIVWGGVSLTLATYYLYAEPSWPWVLIFAILGASLTQALRDLNR